MFCFFVVFPCFVFFCVFSIFFSFFQNFFCCCDCCFVVFVADGVLFCGRLLLFKFCFLVFDCFCDSVIMNFLSFFVFLFF